MIIDAFLRRCTACRALLAGEVVGVEHAGSHTDINMTQFSIPLFWAQPDTPRYVVQCDLGGLGFTGTNGFDATATIPIPDGAAPDPASDHHMLIIDRETELEWGTWDTREEGEGNCATAAWTG